MGSRLFNIVSLYNYLLSVDYVQSLLQGAESLTSDGCRSQPAEGCSSDRQAKRRSRAPDPLCYQPKMSAWVPVSRNRSVSSLSCCSHVINQFGWIWHSHCPLWLPFSWWGRYSLGSVPVSERILIAVLIASISSPLLTHFLRSFLNW